MSAAVRQSQKQLSELQKSEENNKCFECDTSNPQWASPKYGIFICLECAGTHRSLGVHISFVRSVTMDQFKAEELKLMEAGGNAKARSYFEENGVNRSVSIVDKYNSTVAEDYREKLSAEAKGESWTRRDRPVFIPKMSESDASCLSSPHTNIYDRVGQSDAKAVKQFRQNTQEEEPTLNELASDALGAITTGWSWFSKRVTQTVTETTDTYILPGMKQFAESDYGTNARRAVEQFGRKAREAGVQTAEHFNKYAVEALGSEETPKSEYASLFDNWAPRDASNTSASTGIAHAEPAAKASFKAGESLSPSPPGRKED